MLPKKHIDGFEKYWRRRKPVIVIALLTENCLTVVAAVEDVIITTVLKDCWVGHCCKTRRVSTEILS